MGIKYSKQAEKFLKKQTKSTRDRIRSAIHALPAGDIKKLKGRDGYRLRIGDFRVIFDRDGNIIYIERIDNRGQIYKEV
ncbi:MAG: type II toxin-antitoxin system RelE/ParE family toxin [Lachnospiraceae bacterium]